MNSRYETPDALKNDAHTLAEDARALLEATAEVADEKVAEARKRLEIALAESKTSLYRVREKALQSAKAADQAVRRHPYESIALAFGVGALVGCLIARR
jgi:ElaB/YqjD/DUF883 family membrane-anchored ribosome-binding protein